MRERKGRAKLVPTTPDAPVDNGPFHDIVLIDGKPTPNLSIFDEPIKVAHPKPDASPGATDGAPRD